MSIERYSRQGGSGGRNADRARTDDYETGRTPSRYDEYRSRAGLCVRDTRGNLM